MTEQSGYPSGEALPNQSGERMALRAKHLTCTEVPGWPKLAWLATLKHGSDEVAVLHGPCVETGRDWCMEGVWAGDFAQGNFDLTDVVVGTGIRIRGGEVRFVSSGDTLNRLHHFRGPEALHVSNSLSALLAIADLRLVPGYDYATAMESIIRGLDDYVREIPSTRGPVYLTYFNNLIVTGESVAEAAKPSSAPDFTEFAVYRDHLFASARAVGENARSAERRHRVASVTTISSGYDSPATSVVAREAGVCDAVTIGKARRTADNPFDLDDSGEPVARQLGLNCRVYSRARKNYPFEDALWASMGNVGDLNLTLFDYPESLCLLFSGFWGGRLWDRNDDYVAPLRRKDSSGARFSECRLELGVFVCDPTFWGCQNERQVRDIGKRRDMLPWTLGTDYDKPIARRIVEEAGVRRDSFGTRKRASSFNRKHGRPLSAGLRDDFARFMEGRGDRATSGFEEWLSVVLRGIDYLVCKKLPTAVRFSCRDWVALPEPSAFFIWANERRKHRYRSNLDQGHANQDQR
jgi:hypothetical protein